MYIPYVCALCIHYVTLIGSLNTLDTARFPVPDESRYAPSFRSR